MSGEAIPIFTVESLKTPEGLSDLNRILQVFSDNVAGDTDTVRVYQGFGSPEGAIKAGIGSMFQRLDGGAGTTLYVKESGTGASGWVAISQFELRIKVGIFTRDLTTATGTQEITGVGFEPSGIQFRGVETVSNTVSDGYSDGTTEGNVHFKDDGAWIADTNIVTFETATAGDNRARGFIQSFNSDGFTISWIKTNSPTGTAQIRYIAFAKLK